LDSRRRAERAEDSILAGARVMVPEPISPQVKEWIDRSRLVIFRADHLEILPKKLQQFGRIRDLVFLYHPLLEEVEQRE
jgi:hypothetical protein